MITATFSETDPPLDEQLDDASSVLLAVSGLEAPETEGCLDLLTVEDPADVGVMCTSFTESPDRWLDRWRTHVGELPAATWFVTSDEYARSAASGTTETITTPDDSVRIDTVSNPGDLTGVGVAITEQLKAFRNSHPDTELVVCIQAVGTLLQYTDVQQVFRFLHTLSGQFESADAFTHYHLDPAAHDDQTVHTLRTLFDAVISHDESSGWTVQTK